MAFNGINLIQIFIKIGSLIWSWSEGRYLYYKDQAAEVYCKNYKKQVTKFCKKYMHSMSGNWYFLLTMSIRG
jgi:hypothetical protein